jgi:beta-glucosidase
MEEIGEYQGKDDIWARLIAEGRFSTPEGDRRPDWQQVVESPAHTALAQRAAERSIVLLKNENSLLPLAPARAKRVLVVGPLATEVNLGGYSTGKPRSYVNVVDGLKSIAGIEVTHATGCPEMPGQMWGSKAPKPENPAVLAKRAAKLLDEALKAAGSCDVIVAVVGHTRAQLGENLDRDTLTLPGRQLELVKAMHATGKPVVVVYNGGNIHSDEWVAEKVPAVLQMFYAGQETGTALARVLIGEVNPGGKMPLTTPRNVGQSPWYYNHPMLTGPINYYGSKSGPLYPFGHGLSYTKFDYRDAKVEGTITADGIATVSVTIANTGSREGDEVVQLYKRQDYTSVTHPVMELKGFERIHLAPGASTTVRFTLGFDEVKFWKDGQWISEPGELKLMLGSSSADIRLNTIATITTGASRKP